MVPTKSWDECYRDPMGTLYRDEVIGAEDEGGRLSVRWLVMRGRYSLTAYAGLSPDHPTAGWSYELVPLDVHGGLTFSGLGDDQPQPSGWWWYGWDYAHAFDRTWIGHEMRDHGIADYPMSPLKQAEWGIEAVADEVEAAARQLLTLALNRWQPSVEEREEQNERDRRFEEFRKDAFSGDAQTLGRLEREAKKQERLRVLRAEEP